ncbi:hypothetical protein DSCW_12880 [Desulfosarcina widdelii]|uniref:Uncharacterized protein n=1 Tax=Desulfosarcina widdelii TaxID=947919 RepID=A0A5K7Z2X9_9BACT|nr:hypothetical protein [Desulfosarcina widdelii]BBO73871.1 hypothetical protein DSCW_12880 [Desulfosarcina widdelii]
MTFHEHVYLGLNNTIDLQLKADGIALTAEQMQSITKIVLVFKELSISSDEHPDSFDWTTREDEGVVIMALGTLPILPAGTDPLAYLKIYDSENPNGVYWGNFILTVEENK